jgi:excisionase family DNA binding protein
MGSGRCCVVNFTSLAASEQLTHRRERVPSACVATQRRAGRKSSTSHGLSSRLSISESIRDVPQMPMEDINQRRPADQLSHWLHIGHIWPKLAREVTAMSKQSFLPAATIHAPTRRRHALRNIVEHGATVELRAADGRPFDAPELTKLLQLALAGLANGEDVMLLTSEAELTPAEAATILGLSRQYVDRLIDLGDLPSRTLPNSRHRRLRTADVIAFQQQRATNRTRISAAINELIDAGADY